MILLGALIFLLSACTQPLSTSQVTSTPEPAKEIVFYDWVDDVPQAVFDDFKKEFGITVQYKTYEAQEAVIEELKAGAVYDIVILDSQFLPNLVEKNLIRSINYENIPNFKYISANFRDMVYDPGNQHSIPYNWGTTGLVLRSDLIKEPVTSWNDLWKQEKNGKVMGWRGVQRQEIAIALKSLGFSANSEKPEELELALKHLLELKANLIFGEDFKDTIETSAPALLDGRAVMAMGWANDILQARESNPAVTYVLPKEGSVLWGDNFVIPTSSSHAKEAELFLNYLLRPKISAQLIEYNHYPTANEKAVEFVDPKIATDHVIFPSNEDLKNAEIILPLSAAGEKLYNDIWERFLAAP